MPGGRRRNARKLREKPPHDEIDTRVCDTAMVAPIQGSTLPHRRIGTIFDVRPSGWWDLSSLDPLRVLIGIE
jgi:hypothetical protein